MFFNLYTRWNKTEFERVLNMKVYCVYIEALESRNIDKYEWWKYQNNSKQKGTTGDNYDSGRANQELITKSIPNEVNRYIIIIVINIR